MTAWICTNCGEDLCLIVSNHRPNSINCPSTIGLETDSQIPGWVAVESRLIVPLLIGIAEMERRRH